MRGQTRNRRGGGRAPQGRHGAPELGNSAHPMLQDGERGLPVGRAEAASGDTDRVLIRKAATRWRMVMKHYAGLDISMNVSVVPPGMFAAAIEGDWCSPNDPKTVPHCWSEYHHPGGNRDDGQLLKKRLLCVVPVGRCRCRRLGSEGAGRWHGRSPAGTPPLAARHHARPTHHQQLPHYRRCSIGSGALCRQAESPPATGPAFSPGADERSSGWAGPLACTCSARQPAMKTHAALFKDIAAAGCFLRCRAGPPQARGCPGSSWCSAAACP